MQSSATDSFIIHCRVLVISLEAIQSIGEGVPKNGVRFQTIVLTSDHLSCVEQYSKFAHAPNTVIFKCSKLIFENRA